jgi:hypothetical protein
MTNRIGRVDGAGSSNRIAEDLAPFGEAAVGGEDHGALLVAGVDGLEEQIAAAGNTRCVSSLLSCSLSRGGAQFFTPPPRTAPIVGAHSRRQDPKTPVEQALMRGLGTA